MSAIGCAPRSGGVPGRPAHCRAAPSAVLLPPRRTRRRQLHMQINAAAVSAAGWQGQGQQPQQQKKEKESMGARILAGVLNLSSAPYSSYIPEPKTFLHHASAEAKQLWTVGVLLVMARASPPVRLAIAALLLAATVAALPARLWRSQLARLGGLCAVLFFFTIIGAEGVPPVLSDRSLPAAAAAAAAGSAGGAAAAAAGELPASMAQLGGPPYRYVVFHFWFITITKRSLNLALALTGLTFAALQSASLCLVTTPPEAMARAVGRALSPLGLLGLPVRELVLTTLLALRFMATAFEEARNLCLGLASRGINWRQQGLRGTVAICVGIASKLFSNLMARCDNIAVAMSARGFQGPTRHELRAASPPVPAHQRVQRLAADAGVLLMLAALAAAAYLVV
ncbi:hypothetical protein ABPG75_009766 [Micractinium tetrahymenae]